MLGGGCYVCQELESSFLVEKKISNLFYSRLYRISAEKDTQRQAYEIGNGLWGLSWLSLDFFLFLRGTPTPFQG